MRGTSFAQWMSFHVISDFSFARRVAFSVGSFFLPVFYCLLAHSFVWPLASGFSLRRVFPLGCLALVGGLGAVGAPLAGVRCRVLLRALSFVLSRSPLLRRLWSGRSLLGRKFSSGNRKYLLELLCATF